MLALRGRELLIGYALIGLAIFLIVGPFVWIFINSIKHQIDIYTGTMSFQPTLDNYVDVLFSRRSSFVQNVTNSLIVAGLSTAIVLVIGTLAAYSLSRMKWASWISKAFLGWLLIFHMIPILTLVGSWYLVFRQIGLYGSLTALVATHVTINLPMTVWLMMAFFKDIPKELEEAAMVDGCRRSEAFRRIILPLVVPGLIASGILAFVFSWNEFSIAISLTSRATVTVPVGIAKFAQEYETQHGQMAAASIIATIPAIILMLFGQKFVVQGLTMGSVK